MEYDREDRRNPWPWVAIIVGMLIFLGASWWIATASTRGEDVVLLNGERQQQPTTTQPTQPQQQPSQQPTTTQPGTTQQPTVTEQQPPVNIYVERTPQRPEQRPVIVIVPEGQTPPRASDGGQLSAVDLPARFTYQGSTWEASDQSVSPDTADLTDTGASVNGDAIYVERDDKPPYDAVYVETEPGSDVYVKYTKRPSRRSSS